VTLTAATSSAPVNTGDSDYITGVGEGGGNSLLNQNDGADGLVVISTSYNGPADSTAPTQPGTMDDGTTSASITDTPTLSWGASTDAVGVYTYQVALGTTAGGTDLQTWTDVGNVTSTSFSGLSLIRGYTYYASVRAKDYAGNISTQRNGDGWTVSGNGTCQVTKQVLTTVTASGSFVVPADCTTVTVKAWGAGGGNYGGGGGFAKATISVTAGETLTYIVGGGGTQANGSDAPGGVGGGGTGPSSAVGFGGSGGGMSAVKRSTTYLIVAGGGGGGGASSAATPAGAGGGATGQNGATDTAPSGAGGGGGTQSAGGAAGAGNGSVTAATAGTAGAGGTGGLKNTGIAGGGGGGGYYGGGGGGASISSGNAGGGGGGGSGYVSGTSTTLTAGSGSTCANTGDADFISGRGSGATATGGDGLLVISTP
jgi:hypothetical protein